MHNWKRALVAGSAGAAAIMLLAVATRLGQRLGETAGNRRTDWR